MVTSKDSELEDAKKYVHGLAGLIETSIKARKHDRVAWPALVAVSNASLQLVGGINVNDDGLELSKAIVIIVGNEGVGERMGNPDACAEAELVITRIAKKGTSNDVKQRAKLFLEVR